jgi:hypothetical protein
LALYDTLVSALKSLRDRFLIGIGIGVKTIVVYSYVVRASGIVIPPKETQKKKTYAKDTLIQFELSFEDSPFFRTIISDYKEAMTKFESAMRELVADQELVAVRQKAIYCEAIPEDQIEKDTLLNYLQFATKREREKYEATKRILVAKGRPEFAIDAIDFEPVESFEIPANKLQKGTAEDTFVFKLYRPEEDKQFDSWGGKWEHTL